MKRLLKILGVLLLVLLLCAMLLPALLSTGAARALVLAKVNAKIPGELAIDDWSFRWFGAQEIKALRYTDEHGARLADVQAVTVERGLLALVRRASDLGAVVVDAPTLYVRAPTPAPAEETPTTSPPRPPRAASPPAPAVTETEPPALRWPDLHLQFHIRDGRVLLVDGQEERPVVERLVVSTVLAGRGAPLAADATLEAGDEQGRVTLQCKVAPPAEEQFTPDALVVEAELKVESWNLVDALRALAEVAPAPEGQGMVEAAFQVNGSLREGLVVQGALTASDLAFTGGPLTTDQLRPGDLAVDLDLGYTAGALTVRKASITSDLFGLEASGSYGADQAAELKARADANVAAIVTQLRQTLGLREGLLLDRGRAELEASVFSRDARYRADVAAALLDLAGSVDGQAMTWTEPTRLKGTGTWSADDWSLQHLLLESSFLRAQAEGNAEHLAMLATADLDQALKEAARFVDTQSWALAGIATFDLDLTREPDAFYTLRGGLHAGGLSASRAGTVVLPPGDLVVQLGGRLQPATGSAPMVLRDPVLSWQTALSEGRLAMASFSPGTGEDGPQAEDVQLNAGVDLAACSDLLRALEVLNPDEQLAGSATVTGQGEVAGSRVALTDCRLRLLDLVFREGEKRLHEPQLEISTSVELDVEARRATVPQALLVFTPGQVMVTDLALGDWERPMESIAMQAKSTLDLAKLVTLLDGFAGLPDGAVVTGSAVASMEVKGRPDAPLTVALDATMEGLRVEVPGQPPLGDERATFTTRMERSADGSAFRLTTCRLDGSALKADFQGQYAGGPTSEFSFRGKLIPDFSELAAYVRALLEMELEMAGTGEQTFALAARWADDERALDHLALDAAFGVDQIKAFGLDIREARLPVTVSNAVFRTRLQAGVNEGRLDLSPSVQLQDPVTVTLPEGADILAGVKLTDELADELLGLIHPLFKRASVVSGTVDLRMDSFYWPVGKAHQHEVAFSGSLHLAEVRLAAAGLLQKVLEKAKVRERESELGTRTITFACKDGRIACSPLRVRTKGQEIVIGGTVGLDQTLDYVAEVPMSEDLLGINLPRELEGTTLRLPIGGTVSEPRVDDSAVARAAADLGGQAVRKALEKEAVKALEKLFK